MTEYGRHANTAPHSRLGYSVMQGSLSYDAHRTLAREAEELGYTDCWSGEANEHDGFSPLMASALGSSTLRLGTGIVSAFTRGPALLALSALSLSEAAPGRFVLGIGSSSNVIVERWNGIEFRNPLTRVRDTVDVARRALDGEKVNGNYESFVIDGFRLPRAAPDVPIVLGALGERMLELAGQIADGVLLNFVPVSAIPKVVDRTKGAAFDAGRNPEGIEILQRLFVVVTDGDNGLEIARRWIMGYAQVEVYRRAFETFGLGDALNPAVEKFRAGDRSGALLQIPEEVCRQLVLIGTAHEIQSQIAEYRDMGVDTPVLFFVTEAGSPECTDPLICESFRSLAPRESLQKTGSAT